MTGGGRRPFLLKKRNSLLYYLLLWAPYITVYQVTNRFHIIKPAFLSFSFIDRAIPFVPWLVPVYVSYLAYVFFFIYTCENDHELSVIFLLSYFQLVVCSVFFLFLPVAFPVDLFYGQTGATGIFGKFWLWFDAPSNCFPSLHAANSLLAVYLGLKRRSKTVVWRSVMTVWGLLVVISTLFCKQHYAVDIAAGMAVFLLTVFAEPYAKRMTGAGQWPTR